MRARALRGQKGIVIAPGIAVTGDSKPCEAGAGKPNFRPMKEQILLVAASSPQPYTEVLKVAQIPSGVLRAWLAFRTVCLLHHLTSVTNSI